MRKSLLQHLESMFEFLLRCYRRHLFPPADGSRCIVAESMRRLMRSESFGRVSQGENRAIGRLGRCYRQGRFFYKLGTLGVWVEGLTVSRNGGAGASRVPIHRKQQGTFR